MQTNQQQPQPNPGMMNPMLMQNVGMQQSYNTMQQPMGVNPFGGYPQFSGGFDYQN